MTSQVPSPSKQLVEPASALATRGLAGPGLLGKAMAALLAFTLLLPLVALLLFSSPIQFLEGLAHPLFSPALALSLRTSALSLGLVICGGTPLAWWLAHRDTTASRGLELLLSLPVVIPPAVVGVALLRTFGRQGLLGSMLASAGLHVPFTEKAVLLAQMVVSAPFFIQGATSAFRRLPPDVLLVARTLGASRRSAFLRVGIPMALPGLTAGASLAWARSLGEFGATLLFAGNRSGTTQTLPLAIFTALEANIDLAIALSVALVLLGTVLLLLLRLVLNALCRVVGHRGNLP